MARWMVTIPGQPISNDRAYGMGRRLVTRRGQAVFHEDGRPKMITRPVLTDEARTYRDSAQTLMQLAKPSRWMPKGQIRVMFDLHLVHDIDSDNVQKLLCDALEKATGINDRRFLTCVRSKEDGVEPRDARVEISVDDTFTTVFW